MEQSKLYPIPAQQVHRYWALAEPLLQKAIDKGNGEFTADQLRMMCAQGGQQLLIVMKGDKCHCAVTVQFITYPKDLVAYISYIGGRNTRDGWRDFKAWCKSQGATKIQGSTKEDSIVKLWNKLYGFEPMYRLMQYKLED